MNIEDYENPFDAILDFEDMLSEFTGAPYVVLTDCCTHALELCLRNAPINYFKKYTLPHRTYLSVPMLLHKMEIHFIYEEIDWEADGEYHITENIYDSARLFKEDMYKEGTYQCLSFGHGKPLQIGTGGAILLDNGDDYSKLRQMAYDGRLLHTYPYWPDQKTFQLGFHYMMRPEFAIKGMRLLDDGVIQDPPPFNYPDLREIEIV